jgi:dynein heavy chain
MCDWVCAMELYAKVFRDVEPRRIALQKAEEKLAKKKSELAAAEEKLAEVVAMVAALEKGYEESETKKATLIAESKELEDKLVRASQLVAGLSGERDRWTKSIASYEVDMVHLIGDVSIASAFISYAGPFIARYRETLTAQWVKTLKQYRVPQTVNFNFTGFMADPTDVLDWGIQGLPSDNFSIENGVLVERGLRWPLMIDPQGQANNWVKAKEPKLKSLDFQTNQYMRIVETAITYGTPILIQDVAEYLDTSLDPLLRINLADARPKSIMIGEKELTYTDTFRLYITSNQPNPHYKPEITAATTIVNFAVVQKGLEDQMLGIVVKFEEPKLETEKMALVGTSHSTTLHSKAHCNTLWTPL